MNILSDMKRGSRTKRLSLDDFVDAWIRAEDETFPDEGSGGSRDDDDDPGGDSPVDDPVSAREQAV